MAKPQRKQRSDALYEAVLKLNTLEECRSFFDDLCAVTELRAMEQRYDVALLLSQDRVYTEIMEATSASSATISRVNRMLNYGTGTLANVVSQQLEDMDQPQADETE